MYPNRLSRVLFLNLGEDCTNLSEHCQGLFGNWLEIRFLFPVLPSTSGDEGTRTPDFLLAKQALSQLSYIPAWFILRTVRDHSGWLDGCQGGKGAAAFG